MTAWHVQLARVRTFTRCSSRGLAWVHSCVPLISYGPQAQLQMLGLTRHMPFLLISLVVYRVEDTVLQKVIAPSYGNCISQMAPAG